MTQKTLYHRLKPFNARMIENYKNGKGPGGVVLLLTTTGRKSGLPRSTPLQYEEYNDRVYVASARGQQSDWYRNILANPSVHVQIQQREFDALAEPITDPVCIADFLEERLRRHPVMVRLIMCLFDGLPLRATRADLEKLAAQKVLVALHPSN
jgi:deazaflavin-dependent oxidoreductase (nitroreductase family)